jgi:GNAT superfamily N-acetyltransferase
MTYSSELTIEEWGPHHHRWKDVLALVAELNQMEWFTFDAEWHLSSHVLVAQRGSNVVGFLRFVVQEIGPDAGCPAVQWNGKLLHEAKVIAFGVPAADQRQGIGRKLQDALRQRAEALGCYQIRSHSGGDNLANHRLKLSLGYGVHPIVRGDDRGGAYFVLPLRPFDSTERED